MTKLLSIITPTNLQSEREKFLSSHTYSPVFHYSWQDQPIDPTSHNPQKQTLYNAIFSQDHSSITQAAQSLFDVQITDQYLSIAQQDIKNKKDLRKSGTAKEYANLLQEGFDYFNIDYQIEITDQLGFNARPEHKVHRVLISRSIHYEMFSMEGGVRHELAHIIRYLNGEFNQIKRSTHYLPTEEGLASYCQDHVNGVVDNGLVQHALEYLGSSVGVKGSLRDIYNVMRGGGMSAELAWKRASRHKFGFVDTSLPGDIIKPAMYYYHELKVAELSTQDKLRLFIGKIAITDLPDHPIYTGRWSSDQLAKYFFKL